jgi:branched-chain amino acid aminotransferase
MIYSHISHNGKLVPSSSATVAVNNIEWTYGFGVYESIRVVHGIPYFLQQHIERLFFSASVLDLEHTFDAQAIASYVRELQKTVKEDAFNLKMLLIGAQKPEDAQLYIIPLSPVFPQKQWYRDGISTVTAEYERYLPHAKTLNMLGSYMAYRKAKKARCYDALFINREGEITEGSRTNFFAIKDRTIISPPSKDILEGITRTLVLHTAKKHGSSLTEQPVPLKDIHQYDGAFLTSTSSKILPIARIDEKALPIPGAVQELIKHFDAFLETSGGVFKP